MTGPLTRTPCSQWFRFGICLLLAAFLASPPAAARSSPDEIAAQKEQAVVVRELLFHRQYREAENVLQHLLQQWPDALIGYFGMMTLYQLQNLENFDERFNEPYQKWHHEGRKRALVILYDGESDPWELFLAGGALATSGFYKARSGKTLGGLRDGILGLHALEKALEKAPEWADPYLGLGLYDYWRTVFTQQFRFIPFFPNRKKEGMEKLQRAVKKGTFSNDMAREALAWSYYHEEEYDRALPLCEELLQRYPENIVNRLLYAHVLTKRDRYDAALKEYQQVLAIDPALTKVSFYLARNRFEQAHDRQAQLEKNPHSRGAAAKQEAAFIAERYAEATRWLETFLATGPNKTWKALAYELWGEVLYQQGESRAAEEKFRQALQYDYSLYNPKRRLRKLKE